MHAIVANQAALQCKGNPVVDWYYADAASRELGRSPSADILCDITNTIDPALQYLSFGGKANTTE